MTAPVKDRPVYRTIDHRAEDLEAGDVTRNRYGKWDVVAKVEPHEDSHYINVFFEVGGGMAMRTVALIKVQAVKPS